MAAATTLRGWLIQYRCRGMMGGPSEAQEIGMIRKIAIGTWRNSRDSKTRVVLLGVKTYQSDRAGK
jgi:hypothetical protein